MKKKRILIASIIFILIICIVTAVFIIKNRNRSTSNTMYTYRSGDVRCNYSEDNVLYLDDSGILHLIDTASGKDMVYCDKPNCTHEGFSGSNEKPSCPAAFYGLEGAGTVLYNDHLYYVGNMSDEDMTVQYMYVMDSNGENRKKAAKLENVQNVTAVLYRDNYVIGAYSNRIELNDEGQIINDDKPEAGIFVIDLDNYKVYMSDKITSEQANIMGIYYEDGAVYYSTVRFGDDVTEQMMYVVGATQGKMFLDIRKQAPNHFLLVPGVGAQGGSLAEVAQYGMNDQCGLLVNSSRAIIYADKTEAFANVAREAAHAVQKEMAGYLHDKGIIPCKA